MPSFREALVALAATGGLVLTLLAMEEFDAPALAGLAVALLIVAPVASRSG